MKLRRGGRIFVDHAGEEGMAFVIFLPAGHGGKLSVRVPTPEEALARARNLRERGSADVIITINSTGDAFSISQFEEAIRAGNLRMLDKGQETGKIDPRFQAH